MILIVATHLDPHADAVVDFLLKAQRQFVRVDLESVFDDFTFTIQEDDSSVWWRLVSRNGKHVLSNTSLRTVWWRRSTCYPNGRPEVIAEHVNREESRNVLKWLFESLPNHYFPFGHPWSIRRAENKVLQLRKARDAGLLVPQYCFSNEDSSLIRTFGGEDKLIVKSLSLGTYASGGTDYSFRATAISRQQIEALRMQGASMVGFAQKRITRDYDVRAFITHHWVHACQIDVTKLPEGVDDWRPYIDLCNHKQCSMPDDVLTSCRTYLRNIDMPCGHFDFIVDKAGHYNFLECNPNGQWYWLEMLSGAAIAKDVANTLMGHVKSSAPF